MNYNAMKEISNEDIPVYTVLKNLINKTDYINIGCISAIHNDNYVNVTLYYKNCCGKAIELKGVRLLHIGTTKCKINILPAVGDNVLLLCPRDYIEKLEYHRNPEKKMMSSSPYGEVNMCGILIKDEADNNVKTTIKIDEKGAITIDTEGAINVSSKDTVNFDGNSFGGLCKTQELKSQLDIATTRIDTIINALENSPTTAEDGGAAYKTGITTILQTLTVKEDYSNIESNKVFHGDK